MYNQLHDIPQSIGSAISTETLKLLRALVVRFVSEIMSRAIVSREQERIAKVQTKAWRLRENQVRLAVLFDVMSPPHIQHIHSSSLL